MSDTSDLSQRISYENVPGFFIQSDSSTDPQAHLPTFGLKSRTSSTYWKDFEVKIKKLQESAPGKVRYVVCWLARHGQGWHNVCVDEYGAVAWENHWSKRNSDGKITWGPDAKLTPLGETQAKDVNDIWKKELSRPGDPIPVPSKLFSSPLARALATLDLTFKDVLPKDENTDEAVRKPLVMENLREALAPYTSDHRSTKNDIQKTYPGVIFEKSFTEEDQLWSKSVSESNKHFMSRMKATLDHIFEDLLEDTDTFISITTHSGVAAMILQLIGHRDYPLPAGGVVPVVIKATF
ncbi:putative phosphomutase PMU1 OS=Saccharomyces cerevisiae (strain ATCC 204508 / S288c) GN=PMU1 PE=1 SV=1 [Rhizoctonia solani AG-1 IB]|uniref:Putative phosphomutase PMU1 n=1 Tax=Thanatephorus cucumeris (strain AG1-IB / isolate 7/3/14) TaxID=1108050 RepID=A0A0B7FDT5_THACB|nr:putative phosphomutase PMU1 OS=Saccharomyces cerevisiae (strain ATCC 204508 / S288c) GN=PMU1 PE=1 SV=1 [Rhizoctonia solani AG-1 IB]